VRRETRGGRSSGREVSAPRRSCAGLREECGTGPGRRGQAPKGTGGMPRRHQEVGVEGCEMSGGAA
jgi:hypothetical protein